MNIIGFDNVIVCGLGFQTETLIKYLKNKEKKVTCVLVDHFTQKPEKCYLIPSKRSGKRNAFSEVDMLMDEFIDNVPIKRLDMLTVEEKSSVVLVTPDKESQRVYFSICDNNDLFFHMLSDRDISLINGDIWDNNEIIKALWNTNKYLFSEMELMKNCMRRQLKSTIYDFHFEFHLVEHCNLGCAGCTHFSPLAEEEYLSVEEFENDINRLSVLTGGITRFINLLGGEPLLHARVSDLLYIARKAFPNTLIRVVTNGIKIPDMEKEFWESCRRNNIVIGITQYPINIDYNSRINIIERENVVFESFSGGGYPRDEMWRLSLDIRGKERPIENFMRCPRANACIFVSHGKVYNCATMANIGHFNKCFGESFELCKDDYVDIYDVNDAQEILEMLCNPKPFCRYCNIDQRKYGEKWEYSKKTIHEWI